MSGSARDAEDADDVLPVRGGARLHVARDALVNLPIREQRLLRIQPAPA